MKHSWKLGLHFIEILGIFPSGSVVKNPPANAGNTSSIAGPGRSHTLQSNWVCVPQLLSLGPETGSWKYPVHEPQLPKPACPKAHALPTRGLCREKPQLEKKTRAAMETQHSQRQIQLESIYGRIAGSPCCVASCGTAVNQLHICIHPLLFRFQTILEKEMATHSSIPVWRIPCTEEPGGLQSVRSQESDTT